VDQAVQPRTVPVPGLAVFSPPTSVDICKKHNVGQRHVRISLSPPRKKADDRSSVFLSSFSNFSLIRLYICGGRNCGAKKTFIGVSAGQTFLRPQEAPKADWQATVQRRKITFIGVANLQPRK
jgi:hypothetical protein